ncbi:MAG TPA: hypothetical protein VHY37_06930 [Tepidisphaeraceae bacterium]|jgi:hypothetical protein|nr:hypothetical protein [Tepidisphaeraceae bacterium]
MPVPKNTLALRFYIVAMRYEPGPGDLYEAKEFLKAARTVLKWADEGMK